MFLRLIFFLVASSPLWACFCTGGQPTVKAAYHEAPMVFLGTVTAADPPNATMFEVQTVQIRVDEAFKGTTKHQ